jgi:hypothetical protein
LKQNLSRIDWGRIHLTSALPVVLSPAPINVRY